MYRRGLELAGPDRRAGGSSSSGPSAAGTLFAVWWPSRRSLILAISVFAALSCILLLPRSAQHPPWELRRPSRRIAGAWSYELRVRHDLATRCVAQRMARMGVGLQGWFLFLIPSGDVLATVDSAESVAWWSAVDGRKGVAGRNCSARCQVWRAEPARTCRVNALCCSDRLEWILGAAVGRRAHYCGEFLGFM